MIRPNPKSGAEGVSRQGLSVVDSHVHLWDTGLLSYSWLTTNPTINRPHLLADYAKATSGFTIDGMVFVQAEVDVPQAMDEAQWVLDLARKEPRLKGVVPWAPLESGDACRPVLERLSASPLVKGIRRIIEFEPNLDFCVQPGFVKGVRMLAELGLRFDICIKPHQMANTIAMMRRCPDVSFILDHIAKPDIRGGMWEPWASGMREMASFPRCRCKISGVITEADPQRWTVDGIRPYILHAIESFGTDRVLFGGDWPVVVPSARYDQWMDALLQVASELTEEERRKLFRDNAIKAYGLDL